MIEEFKRLYAEILDKDEYYYHLKKATGRAIGTFTNHWFKNIDTWETNIPEKFHVIVWKVAKKVLKKQNKELTTSKAS